MKQHDPVNHPKHYTQGGIEAIEAIKAALTEDEFVGFLKGQILKYTWRSGHKDDIITDTKKSIWYANYLCEFVTQQRNKAIEEEFKLLITMEASANTCEVVERKPNPMWCEWIATNPLDEDWRGPGWYIVNKYTICSGPYENYILRQDCQ